MEDFNFSKKTAVRYLNELKDFWIGLKRKEEVGTTKPLICEEFYCITGPFRA